MKSDRPGPDGAAESAKSPLSGHRLRTFVSGFLGYPTLLPIFFLILYSCKTRSRRKITSGEEADQASNRSREPERPPITPESGRGSEQQASETRDSCTRQSLNTLDWRSLPEAGENLEARYKFYGNTTSTMMVLDLPKYQHGGLAEIFLVRVSGKLLAGKGIVDGADIRADTSLRPVVFDNIQLKGDRQLIIVFKTVCQDCEGGYLYTRYMMKYAISFSDTFRGKKVLSPDPTSVPGIYQNHQAFANIGPDPENMDGFFNYGSYSIASDGADFKGSLELKGYIVTNMMGDIITKSDGITALRGEQFNDILENHQFICYKLVENQYYVRTFVRLV